MESIPRALLRPAARLGAAAQNALEVARFGGLDTGEEPSSYVVVAERPVYRLRRYFAGPADSPGGPPVLLVPPLMLAAEIYDVAPSSSAVSIMHQLGVDPWVVDFGAPEHEQGGLERTLTDHVVAVSDAVDRVRAETGRDVHLGGYSQGGMFAYQAAAYRRSESIDSLITFGSPVDLRGALPLGIPVELASQVAEIAAELLGGQQLPAWVSRTGFRLLDPVKSLRQRIDFLRQLHNRDALLPRERQRRFLMGEGWVAWPGPALADFMRQFVVHNRMLSGGFVIEDRLVTLADIDSPVLSFVGEVDEIAPAPAVRAIQHAAPRAAVYERSMRAGHFGLVVGSTANATTWPAVAGWTHWRAGAGELPEGILPLEHVAAEEAAAAGVGMRLGYGLELAGNVGLGLARSVATTTAQTLNTMRGLAGQAPEQFRRLGRLEQVRPTTRISLGLLLDEQAERDPEHVFVLLEGRAYARGAVKGRIDAVVRGLISVGVREGEHVGVLMSMRPSALAAVAALNRLGAVVVLLRPDGPLARELVLGEVGRILTDPELAPRAAALAAGQVLVLGGGGEERELGLPGAIDMERIDPDAVELPASYRPNPGRARDLAFILFTGEGEHTRSNRITNGRWALSAFGTASAAALSAADTVYGATPIYHPAGLLTVVGGTIAGGARLAITTSFDPATFWDEVRRYGVTIASYTWTQLRELVEAPEHPGERHHPVRLFIGSGIPRGIWRRVLRRFPPAGVLEFYASTEGEAVLVNVAGAKIGSLGRPLPGSARVVVAAYDADSGALVTGESGFVRECARGETGMLLSQVREEAIATTATPLRSVFAPEDAWLSTEDLFRTDEDGDHWLIDHAPNLVRTAHGAVATVPIRDVLGDLDAVDLAVAYGVPLAAGAGSLVLAAVTLRAGRALDPADLGAALEALEPHERPHVVHVVQEIPLTTWYRPRTEPLRRAGLPAPGAHAWYLDARHGGYRRLTAAARKRLAAGR